MKKVIFAYSGKVKDLQAALRDFIEYQKYREMQNALDKKTKR